MLLTSCNSTTYPFGVPAFTPGFKWGSCCSAVVRRSEIDKITFLMEQYAKYQNGERNRHQYIKAIGFKYFQNRENRFGPKKKSSPIYLGSKNLDTFWCTGWAWNCQIIFRCASIHGRAGFILFLPFFTEGYYLIWLHQ
jgi:hypothetical protein